MLQLVTGAIWKGFGISKSGLFLTSLGFFFLLNIHKMCDSLLQKLQNLLVHASCCLLHPWFTEVSGIPQDWNTLTSSHCTFPLQFLPKTKATKFRASLTPAWSLFRRYCTSRIWKCLLSFTFIIHHSGHTCCFLFIFTSPHKQICYSNKICNISSLLSNCYIFAYFMYTSSRRNIKPQCEKPEPNLTIWV